MKNCKYLIVISCVILYCAGAYGQNSTFIQSFDTTGLFISPDLIWRDGVYSKNAEEIFNFKSMKPMAVFPKYVVTGVFCKMEHRIEATSNFAPRFRLGSVNYADWMEGKKPFLSRYAK